MISEDYPDYSAPEIYSDVIFTPKSEDLISYILRLLSNKEEFMMESQKKMVRFQSFDAGEVFKYEIDKARATLGFS